MANQTACKHAQIPVVDLNTTDGFKRSAEFEKGLVLCDRQFILHTRAEQMKH